MSAVDIFKSDSARDRTGVVRADGDRVHIGATWLIRVNRPCAPAMRPYVKLFRPLNVCFVHPTS